VRNADSLDALTSVPNVDSQDLDQRGILLAKMMATIKVYPSDTTVNLEALKEQIKKNLPQETTLYKFEEEPIAFGLVAIISHVIVPEEKNEKMEEVEQAIKSIKDVSHLQVTMMRRL
jgi:translation elongation factor aEF-1 beta